MKIKNRQNNRRDMLWIAKEKDVKEGLGAIGSTKTSRTGCMDEL